MSRLIKFSAAALFVLGVVMAAVAFFSKSGLRNADAPRMVLPKEVRSPQMKVVAARRNLPAGHQLTQEDLMTVELERMPDGGFASLQPLQGRMLAQDVAQGSTITEQQLIAGLAGLLADGERAVSVKVDEGNAVGHKLRPGDWVDVFVVMNRDGQDVASAQARLLLPQKKILAYGEKLLLAPAGGEEDKSRESGKQVARTAVLAVPVEEVNRLLLAEKQGHLQLALRSPLDRHQPSADILKQLPGMRLPVSAGDDAQKVATAALDRSLSALKTADLVQEAQAAQVPASAVGRERGNARKAQAPGHAVEMIRGTQREMLRY